MENIIQKSYVYVIILN